ncbi:hypothetical protein [Brevibacillus fulvus]|uniref:Uncharacterized protein n=1 Tax=Brevibacillus fulvus TaxID=1125967 RepID=A0A939BTQ9_9BACL|nr:hypothetical protein [Brevibacillus fulvus]MBM7589729.1 hypothetical protein [Brevibacillus fulvus]
MALLFIIICIIVTSFVLWRGRILSVLENIAILLFASIVTQIVMNFISYNMQLIKTTKVLSLYLAHCLCQIILLPLLVVLFFQYYSFLPTRFSRILSVLVISFLLTGLEYIGDRGGVIVFRSFPVWGLLVYWVAVLLICLAFYKYYQNLLPGRGSE